MMNNIGRVARSASRHATKTSRAAAPMGQRRNAGTLVICDSDAKTGLSPATFNVLAAVEQLGQTDVSFLTNSAEAGVKAAEMGKTYVAQDAQCADKLTDVVGKLQEANDYDYIIAATSSLGRDVIPRVGAHLDVQPVSDIIGVDGPATFKRPMYAGNAIATVESTDAKKLITVRPTSFPALSSFGGKGDVSDAPGAADEGSAKMEYVGESGKSDDKPQLSSARVVVSGGRSLNSAENFDTVLQPLCDKMKAAMGASRAAVDAGYVPNEMQVGQTGKVVAPELYVAVGISGAIQHLAGMKDSKTIVCINKDPDAPIFQVSDFGLVGDLFEKVPELTSKV